MTAERVRALQAGQPDPGVQMVRVTIVTGSPLTIELPGGGVVAGRAVQGHTYTAGTAAFALIQEPAVGPVFPLA